MTRGMTTTGRPKNSKPSTSIDRRSINPTLERRPTVSDDYGKRTGETHVELDLTNMSRSELLRVQRLARELRLINQILSPDVDVLIVAADGPDPAWTGPDGDRITINWDKMLMPKDR